MSSSLPLYPSLLMHACYRFIMHHSPLQYHVIFIGVALGSREEISVVIRPDSPLSVREGEPIELTCLTRGAASNVSNGAHYSSVVTSTLPENTVQTKIDGKI